jgi:YegS/Rv2252/BmrU family lipid kinase
MSKSWFAVLNPRSGGGRAARDRHRIVHLLRQAGVQFELAASEYASHAIALARDAAASGYRKFLAIGGDGTLNELLNGALQGGTSESTDVTLGLIPVGRGNDWGRGQRIPSGYREAAALLARQRTVAHDVGIAESFDMDTPQLRYFLNVAGVGFDAHVVARTPNDRWGALSYLAALPASFASYRPRELAICADRQTFHSTVFVVFAALGRYCGGGMLIAPDAATDDGLFDAVVIEDISKWELALNLRRLFDGSIGRYRKVRVLRTRRLEIAGPEPVGAQADGELLSPTPIRLSVLPHGVRVVVP